jgi:hypothetical protein
VTTIPSVSIPFGQDRPSTKENVMLKRIFNAVATWLHGPAKRTAPAASSDVNVIGVGSIGIGSIGID